MKNFDGKILVDIASIAQPNLNLLPSLGEKEDIMKRPLELGKLSAILVALSLLASCSMFDTEDEHPFQNITVTVADTLGNYTIVSQDPDDWQLSFSPELGSSPGT